MVWAPTTFTDLIMECEYYPLFFSDHQYLLVKCCLREKFEHGPGVCKFNTSLLEHHEYKLLITSFWSFWATMKHHPDFHSILEWCDQGKFCLREVTHSYSKVQAVRTRGRTATLTKQMHQLQQLFEHGNQAAFGQLKEVHQELRQIVLHEARGAQVRARCQWAEEGETSSSFFFNLQSKRCGKCNMLSIRHPDTGTVYHDPFEILGVWHEYYSHLFTAQECDPVAQDPLLDNLTRHLSAAERAACKGILTVEFFLTFWQSLGADLVQVLDTAFESGQLSTSQRRGLIIVLHKNDCLKTRNWIPTSLLNIDYKIATRATCGHLLTVLSTIIGPDQTCGVRGRMINENLFLIRDLLDHVEQENLPPALLCLDQEKAFDWVDWDFLCRILHKFNFGPDFLRWVQLFYTNIESAVVNCNGWTSSFFRPSWGVRQGCPLSPLLYVISIEVLVASIRISPRITGMTLSHSMEEYRCSGYANDTTVAACSDASIEETFSLHAQYERASGACLNRGKSKGLWAGSWKARTDTPHGLQWVKDLPLLGATFNVGDYSIPTWEPAISKLERHLSDWSGRGLSFQGKATVINTLALSQIWHLGHVFSVPPWAAKRINSAVWHFFWSGKRDLVAQDTVCLPKSQGGFGVVNFKLKTQSFALQWLKRYYSPERSKWNSCQLFICSHVMPSSLVFIVLISRPSLPFTNSCIWPGRPLMGDSLMVTFSV